MQDDRENDKNVENKIEIVIKLSWRGGKIFAVGRKLGTYELFIGLFLFEATANILVNW